MKETKKIISDLKKVGVDVFKSPMGYYTIKTKKFESKLEIIKEVQRILLNNDYSVYCAFDLGKIMKEKLETNSEYFTRMKKEGKTSFEDFKSIRKQDLIQRSFTTHLHQLKTRNKKEANNDGN